MQPDLSVFRLRELSSSQSVDYEDVAKAEELTDQVEVETPKITFRNGGQGNRRQSNALRLRRMSRDEIEGLLLI